MGHRLSDALISMVKATDAWLSGDLQISIFYSAIDLREATTDSVLRSGRKVGWSCAFPRFMLPMSLGLIASACPDSCFEANRRVKGFQ